MKIISVVGARPNFMKISPFIDEIDKYNQKNTPTINHILVHTGQHYDDRMSKVFFTSLNIPAADINLNIGSGSHSEQVGRTMIEFEKVLLNHKPDWVVVVGDVNATIACSITAKKIGIKVCHIEAGLRSFDMRMPEEINRIVTDNIADLLLTPDKISSHNLRNEGIKKNKIKFVGNIMIDTLKKNISKAKNLNPQLIIEKNSYEDQKLKKFDIKNFGLITLHRPSNVDDSENLKLFVNKLINVLTENITMIWPVHPRTYKKLIEFKLWEKIIGYKKIILMYPLGYHELLKLNSIAKIMLTDSGGLQEECTILGTPCITFRPNTERPITLVENGGASILIGDNYGNLENEFKKMISLHRNPVEPRYWDGKAAYRCLKEIINKSKKK